MSGPTNYCGNQTEDQFRAIEWAKTSALKDNIDWSKKTGLLGYSMGGGATQLSSVNVQKIKDLNVGAAVALHPVKHNVEGVSIPILYTAGSTDNLT